MVYVRFSLSLRNAKDLLHERGINVRYESIRFCWQKFDPKLHLKSERKVFQSIQWHLSRKWHLDEIFVKIHGEGHYFWLAVGPGSEVMENFVMKTRVREAALKFLKKLVRG